MTSNRIALVSFALAMAIFGTAGAKLTSDYRGNTVHFCAPGCKRAFDAAPEKCIAIGGKGLG